MQRVLDMSHKCYLEIHNRLCANSVRAASATYEMEGSRASLQTFLIDVIVDECHNFGRRHAAAMRRSVVG